MSTTDSRRDGPGGPWQPEVLAVVTELLDGVAAVDQRTMFGVPAFFVEGRLFCCVCGGGVGLRLPVEQAQSFVGVDGLGSFTPFGRAPMRGWVQRNRVHATALSEDRALILAACEYVRAM